MPEEGGPGSRGSGPARPLCGLGHVDGLPPTCALTNAPGRGAACNRGAKGIVSSGLIPSLVRKLHREEENIQEILLDTLAACLQEDATEALNSRVVPFLKEKLLSPNDNIRCKAARTLIAVSPWGGCPGVAAQEGGVPLAQSGREGLGLPLPTSPCTGPLPTEAHGLRLSRNPPLSRSQRPAMPGLKVTKQAGGLRGIPLEGKKQMWRHDVIPILVHLLRDPVEEVKANAAGALMYATVTTEGKYAALDADAIHSLLGLLVSSLQKARLNAIKALTMLAEAPEGRKVLKAHVHAFRVLEVGDPSKTVQRAAQVAIKVIEWKP
ncbi:Rhabdoid tumor deletion region protein 1 [Myotis brandtii]|uniref:Rhabdoid tumor deletion region protein 1 n=1 Tax=Myotis brandtii TaxID=109478 RepID=S7NT69_MYOBR|nr:Rhabdoid tumor deletion region protein 1 [Myotis brandtii]